MTQKENSENTSIKPKEGEDYIGVTCVFFCHDGKGNIVLYQRTDKCRDEIGNWDCGSGAMKFGESFEQAVRREVIEEYCAEIVDLKFLGVNNVLRNNNGSLTHWLALIFAACVNPEEVKIGEPEKMDKLGWFQSGNFPQPLHSMFLEHFEFVKRAGITQSSIDRL